MNKFVCILKSGGDYTIAHVTNLYNQCKKFLPNMDEFICYSDKHFSHEEIIVKPLIGGLPGKWSMQEAFRETGKVIVTGLDTLFLKDCSWMYDVEVNEDEFYGMHSFNAHRKWANSPMIWNGDFAWLFTDYNNHPTRVKHKLEQNWTAEKLRSRNIKLKYIDDEGLKIASFKRHILKGRKTENFDIIIYHGFPRPNEVTKEPYRSMYRKFDE